jgi:hypothetical protein
VQLPPSIIVIALALASTVPAGRAAAQRDTAGMAGMPGMSSMPLLPLGVPLSRLGSGTSWLPDVSPMFAAHRPAAGWTLMLHGAAFGQYDHQATQQGDTQLGLTDWEMLMAFHGLAGGIVRVNVMTSLQPLVDGPRGYPELLQTGGIYNGGRLVNRQHPHELFGELAAAYDHSFMSNLATSLYVAAAGEPALGPVAFMHRPSGADDPFAPLGHHWQDASHESFGVVTAGIYSRQAKLEGSVFNGRDPDAYHLNLDYSGAKLDSYSGRLTVLPSAHTSLSAWGGYLFDHDRLDTPVGMQRYGVSALIGGEGMGGRSWSDALVWGLNIHHHGSREHNHDPTVVPKSYHLSSSVLVESSLDVSSHLVVYGRVEQVQKTADDLGFLGGDALQQFNIRAVSLGATRELAERAGASLGLGVRGAVNLLPETLRLTYGTRTPLGFAVFLRLRPGKMQAQPGTVGSGAD